MDERANITESLAPFRSLRIAVVGMRGLPSNYSGIERVGEDLYCALAQRGHRVTVFGRWSQMTAPATEFRGVRVVRTGTISWQPLQTLSQSFFSFPQAARRRQFDVVHLHALAPALSLLGYRVKRMPTVLSVHGLDWQRARWKGAGSVVLKQAERSAARFADEIIVVSRALKEYFLRQYNRSTNLVYNALNSQLNSVAGSGELARHELQPQQYVIFVGRLVPEKRVEDLIRSFRQIKTDFNLAIVGDGPASHVSYLRSLAGSDRRIIFTGLMERVAVDEFFRSAAAYVLPSELEGFPMSLLECLEYAVPAVVSDIAPHRELLAAVDGYDLFFKAGNTAELSERLCRVLRESNTYRQLAEAARTHVRREFPFATMVELTEQVLLKAAQRRRLNT